MILRSLSLPTDNTFFLWGPRQVGKSWWLRHCFPKAYYRDLLQTDLFLRYLEQPSLLREEGLTLQPGDWIILDEIQKLPLLLDEVHWLIENRGIRFGLCGSSARKIKRGHANLLGGRALRLEMMGVVSAELDKDFDLVTALNRGNLPGHYLHASPARLIRAYVQDYLTEEIAGEGLIRRLQAFSSFLRSAAFSDCEVVNFTGVARDCGVSSPTVREYFQILEDTLLGRFLPAFTPRAKRRVVQSPKFYFSNVAVVNHLLRRSPVVPGSETFGKALENWIHHELTTCREYLEASWDLTYWRLSSGQEVDFILGDAEAAVEVKATSKANHHDMKGLRQFAQDYPGARLYLVSLDPILRRTSDGVELLSVQEFLTRLWDNRLLL